MSFRYLLQTIPYLLIAILFFSFGFLLGRYVFPFQTTDNKVVTSQSILQSVASQGFLVTQTVVSEQKANYKIDKGSAWSNFWWGHEVQARATMQTSVGVDLAPMVATDIIVDAAAKTVCFKYGKPLIHDTSLVGDIEVSATSGVLKKVFDDNTNSDYNLALTLLKDAAQKATIAVSNLESESYKNADRTLSFVLTKTDFSISSECRTQSSSALKP